MAVLLSGLRTKHGKVQKELPVPIEYDVDGQRWIGINWTATSHSPVNLPVALVFRTIGAWVRSCLSGQPADSRARIGQLETQEFMRRELKEFRAYSDVTFWRQANEDLGANVDIATTDISTATYAGWVHAFGRMTSYSGSLQPFLAKLRFKSRRSAIYFAVICNGGDFSVFSPSHGETSVPVAGFSKFLGRFKADRGELQRANVLKLSIEKVASSASAEAMSASFASGSSRSPSPALPPAKRPRLDELPSVPLELMEADDPGRHWQMLRQQDPEMAAIIEELLEELTGGSNVG